MLKYLAYDFIRNALLSGLLASVVCGIIGVLIVEKKLIMMSGGIAHTAYGGVGLGYLLGIEPMLGAAAFAVLSALGVGFVKRKGGVQTDILIALFWSLGMALGVAFIYIMPGYPPEMESYLFGNILAVTKTNLLLMLIMTAIVVLVITALFNDYKAYMFDESFATVRGMNTALLEYILLALVALSVVTLIRVTGIILVLALMTAPAATASRLTHSLSKRMLLAVLFCALFCFVGIIISAYLNIPSGSTIVILSILTYAAVFLITSICKRVFFSRA